MRALRGLNERAVTQKQEIQTYSTLLYHPNLHSGQTQLYKKAAASTFAEGRCLPARPTPGFIARMQLL